MMNMKRFQTHQVSKEIERRLEESRFNPEAVNLRLKKAAELADAKENEKVLDLGCGNSKILKFLPTVEYTGIDYKPARTKSFADDPPDKIFRRNNVINHNLERGLPSQIRKKKFDIIFMLEFLEHIENFRTLVMQCGQILSEGGRIIISTPSNMRLVVFPHGEGHDHIHCFRKTNLNNLARICGLKMTAFKGTFIWIPILHTFISSDQTWYMDFFLVKFEKIR